MNLKYKYKRFYVRTRLNFKEKKHRKAISMLNQEQLKVFNMVMTLADKNSTDIKFDPETQETLIVLNDMLVTLTPFIVHIDNTHGFRSTIFPENAFEIIDNKLNKEAHRVRRKLKYDVKIRINNFLNNVINIYGLQES